MDNILKVAKRLGIPRKYLELHGDYKAKISTEILRSLKPKRSAGYVVVTGITPTHLGEGKTVTTIGLSMALNSLGKKAVACIREPSLGPFFGVKGGGTGGGRSQVLPADDISLHFTGDIHAVESAHNLAAAFLDNHIVRGNKLDINTDKIFWARAIDVNDRSLRHVKVHAGVKDERSTGFEIAAASELMAILALSGSIADMRKRVGRIVLALTRLGKPVTCEDLKVAGAMAAIMSDALKPNLVQTSEGTPCIIHTGPFANITHGNNSIIADHIGLGLADFVVTEAGFGADCGLEKFVDIKCRESGLEPTAAVLVVSVRALKAHSGRFKLAAGKPIDKDIFKESVSAVEVGCANLEKQIDNIRLFGISCIVAINRFQGDTEREIAAIKRAALAAGAFDCVTNDCYRLGSKGAMELASSIVHSSRAGSRMKLLYPPDATVKDKIEAIAKKVYGAGSVSYGKEAEENIAIFKKLKFDKLPVCMAKTHLSLSHDPLLKGAPKDFVLPIRDVRPSIGAGFLYALCGNVQTMPGLPSRPVGEKIDIDAKGRIKYVHR